MGTNLRELSASLFTVSQWGEGVWRENY